MTRHKIFTDLVDGDEDLIGLIAYGRYKHQKLEFIQTIEREQGRSVSQEEIDNFHQTSSMPSNIKRYREEAEFLLQEFIDNVSEVQIEACMSKLETFRPKNFWHSVTENLVSGVLAAAIAGLLAFGYLFWQQNGNQLFDQVQVPTKLETSK